jgi:hypothetical protein
MWWDSPLGTAATFCPIVPATDDRWWLWSNRWNENWQGKPKYSEKTAPVPLCPPQIPHDLTRARTQAAAVESRRLTAWACGTVPYRTMYKNSTNSGQLLIFCFCGLQSVARKNFQVSVVDGENSDVRNLTNVLDVLWYTMSGKIEKFVPNFSSNPSFSVMGGTSVPYMSDYQDCTVFLISRKVNLTYWFVSCFPLFRSYYSVYSMASL